MPFPDKNELSKLYSSGLSMKDIAKQKQVSLHKIAYWMRKYNIESRSRSEATYLKRNPTGDPFKILTTACSEKAELLALGIALYLGEGSKKQQHGVRLANSDPRIIRIFLNFLKTVCGVNENKIKAWINIFDNEVYQESLDYWSKHTNIPINNFYSPVIRKRKIGTYKNKSKYGTITIVFDNKKLLDQIKDWCNIYLNKYAEVAQW